MQPKGIGDPTTFSALPVFLISSVNPRDRPDMARKGPPKKLKSAKGKSTNTARGGRRTVLVNLSLQTTSRQVLLVSPAEAAVEYAARRRELNQQFARAKKTLDRWWPELKKRRDFIDGHLTGVSVRFRTKFGHIVSPLQVAIVFNVKRKLSSDALRQAGYSNLNSRSGVLVKVVEGSFQLLRRAAANTTLRPVPPNPLSFSEPLMGGAAISPPGNPESFGTLGIVVASENGPHLGFSAQHVVSGAVDQLGPQSASRRIGEVTASRPPVMNFTYNKITESLDCCLIDLVSEGHDRSEHRLRLPPVGAWVREMEEMAKALSGSRQPMPVYFATRRVIESDRDFPLLKYGAGSGYLARGVIEAVDRRLVWINGVNYFNNFSVVLAEDGNRTFAVPGDSGSILLLHAKVRGQPALIAIGLLFASLENNPAVGIACNMSHILRAFKLRSPRVRTTSRWTR